MGYVKSVSRILRAMRDRPPHVRAHAGARWGPSSSWAPFNTFALRVQIPATQT